MSENADGRVHAKPAVLHEGQPLHVLRPDVWRVRSLHTRYVNCLWSSTVNNSLSGLKVCPDLSNGKMSENADGPVHLKPMSKATLHHPLTYYPGLRWSANLEYVKNTGFTFTEQLEILKQKIEEKKKKERVVIDVIDDNPLLSWSPSIDGVAVQTSYDDIYLPPCTCDIPASSDTSKTSQKVYNSKSLYPDLIYKEKASICCREGASSNRRDWRQSSAVLMCQHRWRRRADVLNHDIYLPPCTYEVSASSDTSETSQKVYNSKCSWTD